MRIKGVIAAIAAGIVLLMSSVALADSDEQSGEFHHESRLQVRAIPVGTSLMSDTAYRQPLWDDDDSTLLEGTRLDAGVASRLTPAYLWGGPYLEFVPVAVLELRASVQAMGYWGTFGHLYVPTDDPEGRPGVWDDNTLDRAWDDGHGQSATGWMVRASATPQILLDRWVATAEVQYRRISMGVDGPYYEPSHDLLLEPVEHVVETRPTVGYLFGEDLDESHLLVGVRWERIGAVRAGVSRNIVGVVWDWGVPDDILSWGSPRISGYGGAMINHPTRRTLYPYLAAQATVEF